MAEKKTRFGATLLGLFVQGEPAPAAADPQPEVPPHLPSRAGRPDLPPQVSAANPEVPPLQVVEAAPEVPIDLAEVARIAGVTPDEQKMVDRAVDLLRSLPAETPADLKRQIVGASLQAFGIAVDKILEAVLLHNRALDQYVQAQEAKTRTEVDKRNRRLEELLREAEQIRAETQQIQASQGGIAAGCMRHRRSLREVLDFFGPEAAARAESMSVRLRQGAE